MTENLKKWNTTTDENSIPKCKEIASDCANKEPENSVEKYKKSAAEKVRKSDQNTAFLSKNSLCWNCKRACTDRVHQCSWSREFKPVKGWKAEQNIIREGTYRPLPTYIVKECPKFVKRDPFDGKIGKAIEYLCKYFDKTGVTIYKHLEEYITRWEAETKKKFPRWVLFEKQCKKHK